MDKNIEMVEDLFSQKRILDDMRDYTRKGLKQWEKEAIAFFPATAAILDIGCGMGREAFPLHDMGFHVTGVDISQQAVDEAAQLARESGRSILFLKTDGHHLPFENNAFDVVIIWAQTFGMFYGEVNQLGILSECRRVLRAGGQLSFSGHDREFLEGTLKEYTDGKKFFAYADTDCYWEMFTLDEMKHLAQSAGFREVECKKGLVYQTEDGTILHCLCRK